MIRRSESRSRSAAVGAIFLPRNELGLRRALWRGKKNLVIPMYFSLGLNYSSLTQ